MTERKPVVDLVAALEASLAEAKRRRAAPRDQCVLGADGRCTRWSHDHEADPPPAAGAVNDQKGGTK